MEDFAVTNNTLVMMLFALALWVVRKYMKKVDDHEAVCDRRAVKNAEMMQWIGDGMHAIAEKTGASLPPRPRMRMEEIEK